MQITKEGGWTGEFGRNSMNRWKRGRLMSIQVFPDRWMVTSAEEAELIDGLKDRILGPWACNNEKV